MVPVMRPTPHMRGGNNTPKVCKYYSLERACLYVGGLKNDIIIGTLSSLDWPFRNIIFHHVREWKTGILLPKTKLYRHILSGASMSSWHCHVK